MAPTAPRDRELVPEQEAEPGKPAALTAAGMLPPPGAAARSAWPDRVMRPLVSGEARATRAPAAAEDRSGLVATPLPKPAATGVVTCVRERFQPVRPGSIPTNANHLRFFAAT